MTLQSDKMGRADISGWATATSNFQRPRCDGAVVNVSLPVKSLANLGFKPSGPKLHDPSIVCLPADPKSDPRRDEGRATIVAEVNKRLHDFCVKRIRKKAKVVIEVPKQVDLLADCPRVSDEELNRMKDKIVARDCELHTDEPLPYDRPTKKNGWRK
jgi:hypothetical protein